MKKFIKLLMTIICMMMLTGCIETKRYIAYSVYPVGYLINRIAGDKVNTISIQTDEMVQVSNIVDKY